MSISSFSKLNQLNDADIDFFKYMLGTWKRTLEWREFGGLYQHLKTSNTIVVIEEFHRVQHHTQQQQQQQQNEGIRTLRWSFGKSFHRSDLRFGYEMNVIPGTPTVRLEWNHAGTACKGVYYPRSQTAILNFCLPLSVLTITYRIIDDDTIAVCIVEVDEKQLPTIQYGNMYRIDSTAYSTNS